MTRGWLAALLIAGCAQPADPECGGVGVICRVAGTGDKAFNGDGLPAAQADLYLVSAVRVGPDDRVYLMDFNNHRLRVVQSDGTLATIAGNGLHLAATPDVPATESALENPRDFDFGPDGTIYLVALHDARVLSVQKDGVLRVVAGTGDLGDSGDGGPAKTATFTELAGVVAAPDGSLYVSDGGAQRVRRIGPDGHIETWAGTGLPGYSGDAGAATAATLRRPEGLALDAGGALYVAEASNQVVRRIGPDGVASTVVGDGTPGFSGDGGPASSAQLKHPSGVAVGPAGDLYVADTGNDRVRHVDVAGVITTVAGGGGEGLAGDGGPALLAKLDGPVGIAVSRGRLFIADQLNSCVRVVQLAP